MTASTEHTNGKDRATGFRNITLLREDADSRCIVSIAAVRSENMAFAGEEPLFMTTGNVESNIDLASLLHSLVAELLAHPHSVQLPVCAPSPTAFCHED